VAEGENSSALDPRGRPFLLARTFCRPPSAASRRSSIASRGAPSRAPTRSASPSAPRSSATACKALRARDHRRHLHYARRSEQIHAKAALDGIYVAYQRLGQDAPNRGSRARYKGLEQVERAFGALKGPELELRPIQNPPPPRRPCPCTCCSACWPTTSPGTCAKPGRRCYSRRRPPDRSGPGRQGQPIYQPQRKSQIKRTAAGERCDHRQPLDPYHRRGRPVARATTDRPSGMPCSISSRGLGTAACSQSWPPTPTGAFSSPRPTPPGSTKSRSSSRSCSAA